MSDTQTYQSKSTATVMFMDAGLDPAFVATAELFTANTVTNITTTDKNIRVTTEEIVTARTDDTPGYATIITTILTSDDGVLVTNNSTVSDGSITVTSEGAESVDTETGLNKTVITSTVTKLDNTLDVFAGSTVTIPTSTELAQPNYRYIICRTNLIAGYMHGTPGGDYNMTCTEMYSLMGFSCIKMSEGLYQTLSLEWMQEKVFEVDATTAYYGCTFFSEIRPVAKLWEAKSVWYGEKVPTEITPEIVSYILTIMRTFAIQVIEYEYERRYLAMTNASMIERESWIHQVDEANEWLQYQGANGHKTPLLDYMASEHNMDRTVLANKIIANSEQYKDKLGNMLVEMQKLLKKFKSCTTVWDINILYEDCFGIAMPISEAIALGRTTSETDWTRKPEWRVKGNGIYF